VWYLSCCTFMFSCFTIFHKCVSFCLSVMMCVFRKVILVFHFSSLFVFFTCRRLLCTSFVHLLFFFALSHVFLFFFFFVTNKEEQGSFVYVVYVLYNTCFSFNEWYDIHMHNVQCCSYTVTAAHVYGFMFKIIRRRSILCVCVSWKKQER
jgi:hypothetical protein